MRKTLILTAAMAAGFFAAAAPATAGTQCKAAVEGLGFSQSAAITSWRNQVRSKYGATWSKFSMARNARYSQSGPQPVQFNTVTAQPCRKT